LLLKRRRPARCGELCTAATHDSATNLCYAPRFISGTML
jgi:hypothetical protein